LILLGGCQLIELVVGNALELAVLLLNESHDAGHGGGGRRGATNDCGLLQGNGAVAVLGPLAATFDTNDVAVMSTGGCK
jgi:hypothetical protein